jgi:hypothetical protein
MIVDSFPGEYLGQPITAIGEADNTAQGAVVVLSDGTELYVDNLTSWKSDVRRRQVRVSGTLKRREVGVSGPLVNQKGEHVHGAPRAGVFVIEEPKWELA